MTDTFMPMLNSYLDKWVREKPEKVVLVQYETGMEITYREFAATVDDYALALLDLGIKSGDCVAAMLFLSPELLFLAYACLKIGAICATIDTRLKEQEVIKDLQKIMPRAFFFHGANLTRDFRKVGEAVLEKCPSTQYLVQVPILGNADPLIVDAISLESLVSRGQSLRNNPSYCERLIQVQQKLTRRTSAFIMYTTGTTGAPKPAVLCHENVIVQNEICARGMALGEKSKTLINNPPSHVGGITASFAFIVYVGGTAIIQRCFEPKTTLDAIQKYRVNILAMIPTQFRLLWQEPDYSSYDLSSLELVFFGGASADLGFIEKLVTMAPHVSTALGLTETAGYCTFSHPDTPVEELACQVGRCFSDLAPVTVRAPMLIDGSAGQERLNGELGEICLHPPIVFLGYYNQPEETVKCLTKEGILYSGDLGYTIDKGSYRAIYLVGRRKFIIKQLGYNVFPDEVEAHINDLEGIHFAAVVGIDHRLLGEGIFAFVKPQSGVSLNADQVMQHCKKIASYKRPQYVMIWPADQDFPLTRNLKIDRGELKKIAEICVEHLRKEGNWDSQYLEIP